ncbi:MAG: histidine phosphatase family protein [Lachnospiraceae bacterium]|nr:histidine phosphatase family protein [Lachnospiraceae bacterium]
MKKRVISILLSLILAVSSAMIISVPVMADDDAEAVEAEAAEEAAEEETAEDMTVTGFSIVCGENELTADDGFVQGYQPMVDAEKAAELLGLAPEAVEIGEDEEGIATVVYTLDGKKVCFTVDSIKAQVVYDDETEKSMYLEATPFQPDGDVIYIPLHYLAVNAGFNGEWITDDAGTKYVLTERESDGPDMVIYLTRHGKTLFNTVGRVQGWADTPLTEEGLEVAEDLGVGLAADGIQFAAAYSSDLGRQRQTARVVLDIMGQTDLEVEEIFGLRETFFGDWEGEKESYRDEVYCDIAGVENIGQVYAMGNRFNEITLETDESGTAETSDEAFERIYEALTQIQEENRDAGGANIFVVTSGGITTNLLGHFTTVRGGIANAAVCYFDSIDGVLLLGKAGDTSYAEKGAEIRAAEAGEEEPAEDAEAEEPAEEAEEAEAPAIGMPNPWTDTTAEEALEALGFELGIPEGAENVAYRVLSEEKLLEADFSLDGLDYVARMKPSDVTDEIEDISGLYYEWEHEEECEIGYAKGLIRQVKDGDQTIENCIWLDVVPGLVYSLCTSGEDLDGFDLTAVAAQVFKPMQGDN